MKYLFDKVDSFYLSDIKNETHPSIFIEEREYDILILALPCEDNLSKLESHAFVFDKESYYYFDKVKGEFINFETMQHVYQFLNEKTNKVMKIVAKINESIDDMEEKLYDNVHLSHFMHYWLTNKKDLSRINRILMLGIDVLDDFIARYLKEEDFLAIHFKDIHEHISRTSRSTLLAMDKLNNLYNFYTSRNNEKMNKTIYLLTIVSGIFLPLHLIVGFFGMNTAGLPFDGIPYATNWVMVMMVSCASVVGALILWYRRKL